MRRARGRFASGRTTQAWNRVLSVVRSRGEKGTYVVASEFEQTLAESRLDLHTDLPPDLLTSREADHVDPLITYDRLSDRRTSTDECSKCTRVAFLFEDRRNDLGSGDGAERSRRGGLPEGRRTSDERERKVPAVHLPYSASVPSPSSIEKSLTATGKLNAEICHQPLISIYPTISKAGTHDSYDSQRIRHLRNKMPRPLTRHDSTSITPAQPHRIIHHVHKLLHLPYSLSSAHSTRTEEKGGDAPLPSDLILPISNDINSPRSSILPSIAPLILLNTSPLRGAGTSRQSL